MVIYISDRYNHVGRGCGLGHRIKEFSEFKEFRVGMRSLNSLIEVATKSRNHKITPITGGGGGVISVIEGDKV